MSDLKLFRITDGTATELPGAHSPLEKHLRWGVEANMEALFGVRFLQSAYRTGGRHGGRIDSLGIDGTCSPVTFEYQRTRSENVINQGLFYLDRLMDHQAESELLALELVHSTSTVSTTTAALPQAAAVAAAPDEPVTDASSDTEPTATPAILERLEQCTPQLRELFETVTDHCEMLGDDVSRKMLEHCVSFRRLENFASINVYPSSGQILLFLKVDPDTVELKDGFARDVRHVGHLGAGDLEVCITIPDQLEAAYGLIQRAYENG